MSQEVQPGLPVAGDPLLAGALSYGRGSGLDIGLGNNIPVTNPTIPIPDVAKVSAPGNHGVQTQELIPVHAAPLLYASVLRGQADATTDPNACGDNTFGQGLGFAADAQLLDSGSAKPDGELGNPVLSADSTDPDRAVSQTRSTTQLVPYPDHKGVTSEVRETIAPVTLLKGTANQITIEVLGEWVLTVTAGGTPVAPPSTTGPNAGHHPRRRR